MSGDSEFERRAKAAFDDSAASLDAQTRSRLTQARHAALRELEPAPAARAWRLWLPAAGLAAAAVAAVGLSFLKSRPDKKSAVLEDMDLLAADDDLDIVEDLEFYAWLDRDKQA